MKIAVIGGGAAGLMTTATVREACPQAEIFLFERNDGLGKKVIISGGGRCNVTTGIRDIKTVLTKYPRGGKFLTSAMYKFPPEAVYEWFESRGVPLKIEDDFRVFPQSDNGTGIVRVFERLFAMETIHVLLKTHVTSIGRETEGFTIFLRTQSTPIVVDAVVLTTGGQAYRETGSTGDGYAFAAALGHRITPLAPSLNAFFTRETWPREISGLSFARAKLTARRKENKTFVGPFLFTHKGISGPAVFALSSLVAFERYDTNEPLEIMIDLFPDLSFDALCHLVHDRIAANPKKSFINILAASAPKSLVEILCAELSISGQKHGIEIGKKDVSRALSWLKGISLHAIARGAGDEFVTAGGVNLGEVNPGTMESKVCPRLYFAGEILDIDGYTGGFNLQASWATGHLAGESVAQNCKQS